MKTFELTQDHITLLQKAYIMWYDCESGAPGIDCKRPYGNSGVESDVCEILGWPKEDTRDDYYTREQLDKAWKIHEETQTALQIILSTKSFEPGTYHCISRWSDQIWEKIQ